MRFVAHHFTSGDALITGAAAILVGVILSFRPAFKGQATAVRCLSAVGVVFVAASAVPLANWFYALWGVTLGAWWIAEARPIGRRRWAISLRVATAMLALAAPAWELAWRAGQRVEPQSRATLYVLGDSLSAGEDGDAERSWPDRLRDDRRIDVINLSHVAATASSALKQAEGIETSDAVVLIEIGGNDLLGETTADRFAADLDALLARLQRPGRQLVMLELPLPPFYNAYGRVQRTLSHKHGVVLIPRRELAGVIFAADATVDGLHLTGKGHRLMADMVWRHVSGAFEPSAQHTQSTARNNRAKVPRT